MRRRLLPTPHWNRLWRGRRLQERSLQRERVRRMCRQYRLRQWQMPRWRLLAARRLSLQRGRGLRGRAVLRLQQDVRRRGQRDLLDKILFHALLQQRQLPNLLEQRGLPARDRLHRRFVPRASRRVLHQCRDVCQWQVHRARALTHAQV